MPLGKSSGISLVQINLKGYFSLYKSIWRTLSAVKSRQEGNVRPSKYFTHVQPKLFMVKSWARDGDTDEAIAKKLNVAYSTFREYVKKHPELSAVLKNNKDIADYEVVDSLHKKCVGTYAKEGRAFKCKREWYDDNGKKCSEEYVEVVEVDVFIPPDTMAMAIWLNNRMPDKWRRNANKEKLDAERFEHEKNKDNKKFW